MSLVTIHVRVRDNTDEGFARIRTASRNLRRSLDENFGAAGRTSGLRFTQRLGNVLRQGMASLGETGSGLVQGMSRSLAGAGPALSAALLPVIGVVAMAAGAVLAGALTLGFGAAFVGLGVFLLKELPEVKAAWSKTIGGLRKQFEEAAKPLIPVIQHALTGLQKMGDMFAPHFKKAMEDAAPHLKDFLDRLGKGIALFGKKAFKPMMDGFNEMLDNIDLESFFGSLGDAFAEMGKVVKENAREIGMLFSLLLGTLPLIIRLIAFLAQEWGNTVRAVEKIIDKVKQFWDWLMKLKREDKVLKFVQKGLPGIIDWVKRAISWVKGLKGKTINIVQRGAEKVTSAVRTARQWISNLKGKTVSILQRGAGGVVSAVQGAINTIRRLAGKTVSVGVRGASAAVAAVQRVISRIRNFVGKTVSIGVNFFKGAGSKLASALGFAHGGIVGRAAEGGPRSNMTMVGEQGPELVDLAPGSRVRSNSDTRRILSGNGGGGLMHVTIVLGDKQIGELMIDPLRKSIRTRGGNVQGVLGS